MKLCSLNIALPQTVAWQGREVRTAIFKQPVSHPVRVTSMGPAGDGVGDPAVHGGEHKAVYAFPQEHYEHFARLLHRDDFVPGQFGENLTTSGLLETEVSIGDRFSIGSAVFEVTQPREPCFKLGLRMNNPGIVKPFLKSRRTGFYLRVVTEGELQSGQSIKWVERADDSISVSEITRVRYFDQDDREVLEVAVGLDRLTPGWREAFQVQLARLNEDPA